MRKPRMSRRDFLRYAGAGTAAVLAGCADESATDTPVPPTATAAPPTAAPTTAPPTANPTAGPTAVSAPAGVQTGGTLVQAHAADDLIWDPYFNNPTSGDSYPFYDRLFDYSGEDPAIEAPSLAESWEETEQTLTVKIREGVKFHNGREMVAEDVVANVDRALDESIGHYLAGAFTAAVDGAEAIDKYTVRIDYKKVYPLKLADLTQLFIIAPEGMDNLNEEPAGSGRWLFGGYTPGTGVKYTRNPEYWLQPFPYIDRTEVTFIDDAQSRLANVESGAVDLIFRVPYADVDRIKAEGQLQIAENPPGGLWYIVGFNVTRPPFDNKLVRQAMSYAFDRQKVVDLALLGLVEPTQLRYRPGQFWYDEEASNYYTFDLEKAKALLEEAGVGDGFETEIVVGEATLPGSRAMAEVWQQDLAQIGVQLEISDVPGTVYSQRWADSDFDIISSATGGGRLDPAPNMFASSFYRGVNNKLLIDQAPFFEEYEALKQELVSTIDNDERKKTHDKIQMLMQEEMWVLTYAVWTQFYVLSPRVRDFRIPADFRPMFNNVWLAS